MLLCVLSARRSGKSADAALAPADYLRLRREAAGMDQRELAIRLAHLPHRNYLDMPSSRLLTDSSDAVGLVRQLETPGIKAKYRGTIELIATIIPLDIDVYFQLANEPPARHPTVCRGCGCSDHDPCNGAAGVCSWAIPGVCTRCVDLRIAEVEAA